MPERQDFLFDLVFLRSDKFHRFVKLGFCRFALFLNSFLFVTPK